MSLQKWDILEVQVSPEHRDRHPVVLISSSSVIANYPQLNILMGTTKRPAQDLRRGRVLLDASDGLDHLTAINCQFMHSIATEDLQRAPLLGHVSENRRETILRLLTQAFILP
jgi:mRNA-degrading endonuclease toxin of MazEF toxin-antitoxin module